MDETRVFKIINFDTNMIKFVTESFEELKKRFKHYYLGRRYIVVVDYFTDGEWLDTDILDWNHLLGK